jgi:hypothetical protein
MTARVRIQAGTQSMIRVSLPGVDVDNANLDQLCFDAAFGTLFPFIRGYVSVAPLMSPTTVGFPESLPLPPLCFFSIDGQAGGSFWVRSGIPAAGNPVNRASVTTGSVTFYINASGSPHHCYYNCMRQAI